MSKAAERRLRECDATADEELYERSCKDEDGEDEVFEAYEMAPAAAHADLTRFFAAPQATVEGGTACAECGAAVAAGEAQTHADWHFARSLQREERSAVGGQQASRGGKPAKKAGPMDAFLRR